MNVVPFCAEHLRDLHLQPAQAWMQSMVDAPDYVRQLLACDSYTALVDGDPVAVAGLVTVWPGRAHLSALVSDRLGASFVLLHREVKRRLDASTIRRIEATVDGGFEPGHRWLRMLGFRLETPDGMPGYLPSGRSSFLYARVQ